MRDFLRIPAQSSNTQMLTTKASNLFGLLQKSISDYYTFNYYNYNNP